MHKICTEEDHNVQIPLILTRWPRWQQWRLWPVWTGWPWWGVWNVWGIFGMLESTGFKNIAYVGCFRYFVCVFVFVFVIVIVFVFVFAFSYEFWLAIFTGDASEQCYWSLKWWRTDGCAEWKEKRLDNLHYEICYKMEDPSWKFKPLSAFPNKVPSIFVVLRKSLQSYFYTLQLDK